jgi:hypothetical protein
MWSAICLLLARTSAPDTIHFKMRVRQYSRKKHCSRVEAIYQLNRMTGESPKKYQVKAERNYDEKHMQHPNTH